MTIRIKLDENLSPEYIPILAEAGHDVTTGAEEGLRGVSDQRLGEACRREGRVVLTADRGFGHIIEHPPAAAPGLIVLRHPQGTLADLRALIEQVIVALRRESPAGTLWIVEPGRIWVHGG